MKSQDFAVFLEAFSEFLDAAGTFHHSRPWRALVALFNVKPSSKVGDICKAMVSVDVAVNGGGPFVQDLVQLAPAAVKFLTPYAKKQLLDDLKQVAETLSPYSGFPVENFVEAAVLRLSQPPARPVRARAPVAINLEAVHKYLVLLEAAFRDEQRFPEVFQALTKDKAIKKDEARQLAHDFAGATANSKGDALNQIWARHETLIGMRARAKATGERTAA